MPTFFDKINQSAYLPSARTTLLVSLFLLMSTSLLMIISASLSVAIKYEVPHLRFFYMQLLYIGIGSLGAYILYRLPLQVYFKFTSILMAWAVIVLLLLLTLLLGDKINGSRRWLNLGIFNLQTAEFAKVLMVVVISDYVVRRSGEVRQSMWASWKLVFWYVPVLGLFLLHPDFGSFAVVAASAIVILFISGVPNRHFWTLVAVVAVLVGMLVWFADYRQARVLSYWNPFDDTSHSDFQLARSLSAFARGEFSGVGYGNSVLKLAHLPEAHTDFLLSITGEELGFLGVSFVLVLQAIIVASIMKISHTALKRRQLRLSYMVFGFATVLFGQVLINAGMAMGLLPPKGLTLPFYSFGGSSLLSVMMMIGIVLKVDKVSEQIHLDNKNREY